MGEKRPDIAYIFDLCTILTFLVEYIELHMLVFEALELLNILIT